MGRSNKHLSQAIWDSRMALGSSKGTASCVQVCRKRAFSRFCDSHPTPGIHSVCTNLVTTTTSHTHTWNAARVILCDRCVVGAQFVKLLSKTEPTLTVNTDTCFRLDSLSFATTLRILPALPPWVNYSYKIPWLAVRKQVAFQSS